MRDEAGGGAADGGWRDGGGSGAASLVLVLIGGLSLAGLLEWRVEGRRRAFEVNVSARIGGPGWRHIGGFGTPFCTLCKTCSVKATIDLPETVFDAVKACAKERGASVEDVIVAAVEREVGRPRNVKGSNRRVGVPLIRSRHPGVLRSLTNTEVDQLLD